MTVTKEKYSDSVDASPVKSFFVEMLTRDIELIDAVLDLLDNCIDGILRQKGVSGTRPYEGYLATIRFDEENFSIEDNCGGIPKKLSEYAFKMGRPDNNQDEGLHTVGTYGIGMKRAIFKIGKSCKIFTKYKEENYSVEITPKWIDEENNWMLPRKDTENILKKDGTNIYITKINKNIAKQFMNKEGFEKDLVDVVKRHYAIIIQKGFKVNINDKIVIAKPIKLLFEDIENPSNDKNTIRPFIYKTTIDEVNVFLAVGFTRPPPSRGELEQDQNERKYSTEDAGWSIICNDRVVLSYDKSRRTGWGEAGVPSYHTQFIAISGFVEFSSNKARKLPMTTTKRGIDANSEIYLEIKDKMREGLKRFITYTNKWKGREGEAREQLSKAQPLEAKKIEEISEKLKLTSVKRGSGGSQYGPPLPMPKLKKETERISFTKKTVEVKKIAEYLFPGSDPTPALVGEECFNIILKEAEK